MAKMPRHKRMYKDSPQLERGEDGNMQAVKKSSDSPNGTSEQTDGEPDMEPLEEARIQEIKDMHSRHEKEMSAIHKRHQKEDAKKYDNPNGDSNEKPNAGKKKSKKSMTQKKIRNKEILKWL